MKRCPNCNSAIDENDKFCPFCGSRVDDIESIKEEFITYCPICGSKLNKNDAFCPKCGEKNPLYEEITNAKTNNNFNSYGYSSNNDSTSRASKYRGRNIWSTIPDLFINFIKFGGRACRAEYWFPVLILGISTSIIASILGYIIPGVTYVVETEYFGEILTTEYNYVTSFFEIVLFLPFLSCIIRRLRDAGRSPLSILLAFLPIIGWIILIVFLASPSVEK